MAVDARAGQAVAVCWAARQTSLQPRAADMLAAAACLLVVGGVPYLRLVVPALVAVAVAVLRASAAPRAVVVAKPFFAELVKGLLRADRLLAPVVAHLASGVATAPKLRQRPAHHLFSPGHVLTGHASTRFLPGTVHVACKQGKRQGEQAQHAKV